MAEILNLQGVTKSFGPVTALDGVDLSVNTGEVVALLGDNGAGKSTLIKIISGVHARDGGQIIMDGRAVEIESPRAAMDLGIETIHQDATLALDLSIARNLFLGREPTRLPWLGLFAPLDRGGMRREAAALLARVGITKALGPTTPVAALSGGERQSISISRAMHFFARLIILDEPTNNLGVEETRGVLGFIREIREAGQSAIYITHNLHHVFQVADRAIIMRQGRVVADLTVAETDLLTVEAIITGADPEDLKSDMGAAAGEAR